MNHKFRNLLFGLIGITLGGIIGALLFGTHVLYSTLSLYLLITIVIYVELYIEDRNKDKKGEKLI